MMSSLNCEQIIILIEAFCRLQQCKVHLKVPKPSATRMRIESLGQVHKAHNMLVCVSVCVCESLAEQLN